MRKRALIAVLLSVAPVLQPAQASAPSRATPMSLAVPVRDVRFLRRPVGPDATALAQTLSNASRYLLGDWWAQYMTGLEPYYSAQETLSSEDVRRFASAAYAVAVAVQTRAYDSRAAGVPTDEARQRAVQLVQFLVRTHKANSPPGWGDSIQSALWAAIAANAGWLLRDDVPLPDQLLLARMLAHEADTVVARPMHYLRDRGGRLLTPGNTGAEELAWDALGVFTAAELLPNHERRPLWTRAAYKRMVASYSRPADTTNPRVVNGAPVSTWVNGSNIEPNGFVVNHGYLHPDYMTCAGLNLVAATIAPLVGDGIPRAAGFNVGYVYGALQRIRFETSHYRRPGGTVYIPKSGEIYYPQGSGWGRDRQVVFAAFDEQVSALGLDQGLRVPARYWARLHLDEVRKMQARSDTGQTYQAGDSDTYPLREEQVGLYAAWAYLTRVVANNDLVRWDDGEWAEKTPR